MEDIIRCYGCDFKMVKSQLYKTLGFCPRCKVLCSKAINTDTGGSTSPPERRYPKKN